MTKRVVCWVRSRWTCFRYKSQKIFKIFVVFLRLVFDSEVLNLKTVEIQHERCCFDITFFVTFFFLLNWQSSNRIFVFSIGGAIDRC